MLYFWTNNIKSCHGSYIDISIRENPLIMFFPKSLINTANSCESITIRVSYHGFSIEIGMQ